MLSSRLIVTCGNIHWYILYIVSKCDVMVYIMYFFGGRGWCIQRWQAMTKGPAIYYSAG